MKIAISALAMASVLMLGVGSASAGSPAYCDGYARNYANSKAGGNAVGGALTGAIGGAVIGGILGGKKGVGAGAAIGGAGGLVVGGASWQKYYNNAYYKCINSGPAYVKPQLAPVYVVPPVGSYEWKQQCSYKYKSFNWDTGYFLGYDGQYHVCALP